MGLSAVLFALMAVAIRFASHTTHAFEIAFFRNLFGLMFALPLLVQHGPSLLKTDKLGLYTVRCVIGMGAMLTGFWSLSHLPLAQAVAISFSTPLFVTIGAVLVLGEVVRARRWTAVLVGFLGVLVMLRVWQVDLQPTQRFGSYIALLSALLGASAAISIKFLSRTEKPDAIVFYMVLIMTPMSLLPALPVWTWPDPATLGWLIATGALGTFAHRALTKAYQLGDVSALTPLNFVQLPVVAICAWLWFGETPDRFTALGALIVFASVIYIAHREAVLARRATTDPAIAPASRS